VASQNAVPTSVGGDAAVKAAVLAEKAAFAGTAVSETRAFAGTAAPAETKAAAESAAFVGPAPPERAARKVTSSAGTSAQAGANGWT
jgi:hypothetical protein